MKNNFTKILFVIFTAIGMLGFSGQAKAVDPLVVEFEKSPLFSEANFLPGVSVTRFVKVTNNSGSSQRIATQPLNILDPNHLGDVLNLVIKEGDRTLYNNALSNFLGAGEVFLSNLAGNGTLTKYDFVISFYSGTQNTFQGRSLGFDILIGFQGTEGGLLPGAGSSSGGGGGGWLPPGLTITEPVTIVEILQASATIMWDTSYLSTSQVIYSSAAENHILDLTDSAGTPPKYGYAHTTAEYDTAPKIGNHLVTITGLTPGTTYYFRAVSHASLAISGEQSFTTLIPGGEVAGAATTGGGQTGGQLGGGRGGFVAAAETGLAESINPTPAAPAVAGESTCLPIPWWPFGYVLLFLILGTAQKMGKRVSAGGTVLWIALLVAALLWWWLEPCGAHFWVWPVLMLIVFLVSLRFYLKKSSSEEIPA